MIAVPSWETYQSWLLVGLVGSALTAVASAFVKTPYGRFASDKLGPSVPIKLGWLLMELPSPIAFYVVFSQMPRATEPIALLFAAIWTLHYGNRAVYFPLAMRARPDSRMGAVVFLTGIPVVVLHAWLYATWVGGLAPMITAEWWADPRLWAGLAIYLAGFGINVWSDARLRGLRDARKPGDDYLIPRGGLFEYVSCPHYLGEIIGWVGLAIAAWCPGGLFVLTITLANLVPRAQATHAWYREHFADYPDERRALVPFVW